MKVHKKPRKSIVEVVDDAGKSVLRYRGHDRKLRYVASSDSPEGGGGGAEAPLVEVTHAELKAMRDGGKLTAGALYRITDYNCTTTQENTQSAGHQFDIVLLALSENKLAEEGWAMMHDNVYDVTFNDGVTKKCYLYNISNDNVTHHAYNVVDISTLLGDESVIEEEDMTINEENKTAIISSFSSTESDNAQGLTYNYFQNSNLSAWKVWYSLDNDKSRFAWADNGTPSAIWTSDNHTEDPYYRDASNDMMFNNVQYYAWYPNGEHCYTTEQQPSAGDILWREAKGGGVEDMGDTVVSFVPASNGGKGVIYRLIDEWGNDVPYDFKNIQYDNNGDLLYAFMNGTDSDYSLSGNVKDNRCFLSVEIPFMPYYINNGGNHNMCISNIFLGASVKNIVSGGTFCNIYKRGILVTQ